MGSYEYLKGLEGKIRDGIFFYVNIFKNYSVGVGIQGLGKLELEVELRKKFRSRAGASIWSSKKPVKIGKFELKCICRVRSSEGSAFRRCTPILYWSE